MAQEYEIRPDGNGGWRVGPVTTGCGTVVGVIVIVLIMALAFKFCDEPVTSDSTQDTQVNANISGNYADTDLNEVPPDGTTADTVELESLHILGKVGNSHFANCNGDLEDAYGTEYFGSFLDLSNTRNIANPNGSGYITNIELVAGQQYHHFSGTYFASAKQNESQTVELFIYADDVLVYSSGTMNRRTMPVDFKIDINNCNILRIEIITPDSYYATGYSSSILLVNGQVSK